MGPILNGMKKVFGKIDPFGGKLLGADRDDMKKYKPQPQYYGGSQGQLNQYRQSYAANSLAGREQANAGVAASNAATSTADQGLAGNQQVANQYSQQNMYGAQNAGNGFTGSLANYNAGRGAQLGEAGQLDNQANNIVHDYQQTSDMAFRANQDANQRQAMGLAAGHGASGLRSALAGSTQGNAQAAQQAEITRANEFNQAQQLKQNALTSAAGIRSGVGSQDQGAAGLYSGQQQAMWGNAINANAQGADVAQTRGTLGQNAGQLQAQTGLANQSINQQSLNGMEGAQLGSSQTAEDQRQLYQRQMFNDKWSPIMSSFNQA